MNMLNVAAVYLSNQPLNILRMGQLTLITCYAVRQAPARLLPMRSG